MNTLRALVILLGLLLAPAYVGASAEFPNEPAGSVEITNCPFTNALCSGMYNVYNTLPFASPGGAGSPLSPPYALHENMAAGSQTGNGQWGMDLPSNPQELFIGAWWQPGSEYMGYSNNTNKQIFARRFGIDNNFIVWQGLPGASKVIKFYLQATYDNCHISSHNAYPGPTGCWNDPNPATRDGTGWFNPNINSAVATIAAGSGWHKIEVYLKASSTFTSKDGVVKIWVDGTTFQVKYGASVLFTQALSGTDGTAYPYSVSQAMTTGQTIDFIVTPGANNTHDSTALNPTIAWSATSGTAPVVTSFTPTSGATGTDVTITGTNFVPSISGNTVKFNGLTASVSSASATTIVARVPLNATTGKVNVTTSIGTDDSTGDFTVPLTGTVGIVTDLRASASGQTSASVTFTAITDGAGSPAKYDIRIAAGLISWGDASGVAAGTCTSPYLPGVANQVVTCTVTGLTKGTLYQLQLIPYKNTLGVDAVYSELSNIAAVTTQGDISDVPVICSKPNGLALPVFFTCPKPPGLLRVSR